MAVLSLAYRSTRDATWRRLELIEMESDGCREGGLPYVTVVRLASRGPGTAYSLGESTWRSELVSRNAVEVGWNHDPSVA